MTIAMFILTIAVFQFADYKQNSLWSFLNCNSSSLFVVILSIPESSRILIMYWQLFV